MIGGVTVRFVAVKDGNLELRFVMEQEMLNAMKFKYKRNMSYELSQPIPKRLYPLPVKKKRWHEESIYYDEKQRMIDRNGLHGKTACGGLHHMNDEFDPPTARRASLDAQHNCNPQAFCHQGTSRDIDLIIPVEERPMY